MKKLILAATILALGFGGARTASAGGCGSYNTSCNWGAAVAGFFAGAVVTAAIQNPPTYCAPVAYVPAYCPQTVVYAPAPPVVVYRQPAVVVTRPVVAATYYRGHGYRGNHGYVAYRNNW